jgi:hypothetical protein
MLVVVTPATLTVIEAVPAATVTMPLRLNFALPFTCSAVAFGLVAQTPAPVALTPYTPTPFAVAWP